MGLQLCRGQCTGACWACLLLYSQRQSSSRSCQTAQAAAAAMLGRPYSCCRAAISASSSPGGHNMCRSVHGVISQTRPRHSSPIALHPASTAAYATAADGCFWVRFLGSRASVLQYAAASIHNPSSSSTVTSKTTAAAAVCGWQQQQQQHSGRQLGQTIAAEVVSPAVSCSIHAHCWVTHFSTLSSMMTFIAALGGRPCMGMHAHASGFCSSCKHGANPWAMPMNFITSAGASMSAHPVSRQQAGLQNSTAAAGSMEPHCQWLARWLRVMPLAAEEPTGCLGNLFEYSKGGKLGL